MNARKKEKALRKKTGGVFTRENIAKAIFTAFAAFSVFAVAAIVGYILYASLPAFRAVGFFRFVFGRDWFFDRNNEAASVYGILPMIATSLALTLFAVALGGVLAVFTAVFIVYYCPKRLKKIYTQLVNLLAGIPSLIFGYFGMALIKPLLQNALGVISASGVFLSGLVLAVMILPTVASVAKNSLQSVPLHYYEGALALGCSHHQAVWKTCVPAAKNGIVAALILGIGRAIGETMAVQMLLGGSVNFPYAPFLPVRSLTSNIVQEFADAAGTHRSALIATGFILLVFILVINGVLRLVKKNDAVAGNKFFSRKLKEGNEKIGGFSFKKGGGVQSVLCVLSCIAAALVAAVLLFLIGFVLVNGLPHVTASFLFGKSTNANATLLPAFVSTGAIILLSLAVALPLGIGAAIYLNEYAKRDGFFVRTVRLFTDTLAGVPSVLFGLFGALFFGEFLHMGYSILCGALTMALMILPTVIRSVEQSLSEVPDSMREASYALGAGKVRTVFAVVLPQALSGIVTSVILSVGRIVGESAALIFTAGSFVRMPKGLLSPGSTFAVFMYDFMSEGLEAGKCYATAVVLIAAVVLLNVAVMITEHAFSRRRAGAKSRSARQDAKGVCRKTSTKIPIYKEE